MTMTEISLSDILTAREERVKMQSEIIKRFNCPIISFTMNIAGPVKNSPTISRSFTLGLDYLDRAISEDKVLYKFVDIDSKTGPLAIYALNEDPDLIKSICVAAEEKTALGRLFDMDVIDTSLKKRERDRERGCIVCGAPGRACAAGRLHSLDEIISKMNDIMRSELLSHDTDRVAALVRDCLISEVETTPKPGLVDIRNNGSHKDMSPGTFEKSANALVGYFAECVKIGADTARKSHADTFSLLRNVGIDAEGRMYSATDGVNTHKGAIYSLGIICGAIGRLWTPENPIPSTDCLLKEASKIAESSLQSDLAISKATTAGERMYLELGSLGIRGEAASGFISVRNTSLPRYRLLLESGYSKNNAGAITLISLIASLDDTAIYNRGGKDGLSFAKAYAKDLLEKEKIPRIDEIEKMDELFIQKNLSPGGSADLLAITYFLYELEKIAATQA